MSKVTGSELFGTDNISMDEAVILVKSIRSEDPEVSPEEVMSHVYFFDDCLSLLKVRTLSANFRRTASGNIRKNSAFSDMVSKRMDQLISEIKEIRGVDSLIEEEVSNG